MLSVSILLQLHFILCVFFFFFKQKTAYEMRISDWSSDVCSSDLALSYLRGVELQAYRREIEAIWNQPTLRSHLRQLLVEFLGQQNEPLDFEELILVQALDQQRTRTRSEEHTSELQSLMRISYAVFCLKQKKHIRKITITLK